MFCLKCGEAIPDGSNVCPKCGAELAEKSQGQTVVYASQKEFEPIAEPKVVKKVSKKIIIGIIAVICIVAIILVVNGISKASLKKALVKEWYAVDGSIIKVLDIRDDEIEYRLETGYLWMDTSLGTYDWKPISRSKIKIKLYGDKYQTFTVKLTEDKNGLTISPAITSVDSSEIWCHID